MKGIVKLTMADGESLVFVVSEFRSAQPPRNCVAKCPAGSGAIVVVGSVKANSAFYLPVEETPEEIYEMVKNA